MEGLFSLGDKLTLMMRKHNRMRLYDCVPGQTCVPETEPSAPALRQMMSNLVLSQFKTKASHLHGWALTLH